MKTIIVGAGLAGLTCAKVLAEKGHEVTLFEASDGIGGRVRTDEREGFLLDRGFQVYFSAYPVAKRHLDHDALNLQPFDPGAVVHRGRQRSVLSDPQRDPKALVPSLLSDVATFSDKLRTLKLVAGEFVEGAPSAGRLNGNVSALSYLRDRGFSQGFIDDFYRPFYGGIFLDRSLSTSARVLRFTLRMLASGSIAVPARGMGEIPRQLAACLPEESIRLNIPVEHLLREGERVVGVKTDGGEEEADAVVVATNSPVAGELTGLILPGEFVGQLCVYYTAEGFPGGKKILLNADAGGYLNNAVQISDVAPTYAPRGQNLLNVVTLEGFELPDEEIYRRGIEEITRWYPEADLTPLAIYRVPYAQFTQPPGIHEGLPENRTGIPGLVLAGEYTEDSSINGSMLSGEQAAEEVMRS